MTTISKEKQVNTDNWATPPEIFDPLDAIFHFDVDVCADYNNNKVRRFMDERIDCLTSEWGKDTCWMNPPYSRGKIGTFMQKAYVEFEKGATVVALVPASVSTKWFHLYAIKGRIYIRQKRIRFLSPKTHVSQGSDIRDTLLVVYSENPKKYDYELSKIGWKCINE